MPGPYIICDGRRSEAGRCPAPTLSAAGLRGFALQLPLFARVPLLQLLCLLLVFLLELLLLLWIGTRLELLMLALLLLLELLAFLLLLGKQLVLLLLVLPVRLRVSAVDGRRAREGLEVVRMVRVAGTRGRIGARLGGGTAGSGRSIVRSGRLGMYDIAPAELAGPAGCGNRRSAMIHGLE